MRVSEAVAHLADWRTAYLVNEPGRIIHAAANSSIDVMRMGVINKSITVRRQLIN